MMITYTIQGGVRFKTGFRAPEDTKLTKQKTKTQSHGLGLLAAKDNDEKAKALLELETRWARIVSNDLENIPIGLIISWATLFSAYSPFLHSMMMILFVISRSFHTYFYAYKLQPHRTFAWAGAVVAVLVMSINGIIGFF
jgi:uncharacterized membrane protein YecN with MAPEG domain